MGIRYQFIGRKNPILFEACNYKSFLVTITNGRIDYAMSYSVYNHDRDMENIQTKILSNESLKKIEEDIDTYILTLFDTETEKYEIDNNDDSFCMIISLYNDITNDLENGANIGFLGSRKISNTSQTAIRIKKAVEMLGDCLAIDDIELSYNRLKIDNRVIDCNF